MRPWKRSLSALLLLAAWGCGDLELGAAPLLDGGGAEGGADAGSATGLEALNGSLDGDWYGVFSTPGGLLPLQLTLTPTSGTDRGTYELKCYDKSACPDGSRSGDRDAGPGPSPFGSPWFAFFIWDLPNSTKGTYRLVDLEGDGSASGFFWFEDTALAASSTFGKDEIAVGKEGDAATFVRKRPDPAPRP